MNNLTLSRVAGWFLLAFACAATPISTPPRPVEQLDAYVVSATRTPQDRNCPPAASRAAAGGPAGGATVDLRTALAQTPGVGVVSSGATGGQSSIFLRGANSDQTLSSWTACA